MLVYRGDIKRVREAVDANRQKAERAYTSIFGRKTARKLDRLAEELLVESAFQSPLYLALVSGFMVDREANHFSIRNGYDAHPEPDDDGNFKPVSMTSASFFIFSEEGFERSTAQPPWLGSFMHEFNHFAAFALQERPLLAFTGLALGLIGLPHDIETPTEALNLIVRQTTTVRI